MKTNLLGAWLNDTGRRLAACADEPQLEAQVLAGHVLRRSRTWILAHQDEEISAVELEQLALMVNRRLSGEPLPYLLGHWEFYGVDFVVSPAVLIPRPETEFLVENALAWLQEHAGSHMADVGTGSGCIAVSVAQNCADVEIYATDSSPRALRIASINIKNYRLDERIHLWQGDLLSAVNFRFDLVCANLPYIPSSTVKTLDVANHEPISALDGGEDGLDLIRRLLTDSPRWMAPGGLMLLEIESGQRQTACEAVRKILPDASSEVLYDLAGLPRLLRVEYAGKGLK